MSDIQKEIDIFLANNKQTWHTEDDLLCLINAYVAGHSSRDPEVKRLQANVDSLKQMLDIATTKVGFQFLYSAEKEIEELKKEIERLKRDTQVVLDIVDGGKSDAYEKLSNIKAFLNF